MKKYIVFLFLFFNLISFSQEDAWVYFNAKPDSQVYFADPLLMLTQRSLDRRILQNIPLDDKDIPMYQPYIDQIAAIPGIIIKAKSKWFNALHIRGTQANIQALSSLSFVDHIDFANKNLNVSGKTAILKENKPVQKAMETAVIFDYGTSANQIQMLNGHLLHQQNYTGTGKIIAVMDGGFPGVDTAAPFSRIRDNNQILGGYDYVTRNPNFYSGISHGTLVLSTMGGYVEGQLIGTAPDASYYLFITEDGSSETPLELSLWVEAAEEADRLGVDIISTSLGYTTFDNPNYNFTYADMNGTTSFISKGVDVAFSRGMICVVSAGNDGNNNWQFIASPADANHALTVGAVNSAGNYASFSSQGPTSDNRIKPDVMAQGANTYAAIPSGTVNNLYSGTSFSGPIIAGMVASFWQALPSKTNAEIVQLIKESSSVYANPTDELGYGIPNFSLALSNALSTNNFLESSFSLYPNPFQSNVFISFSKKLENTNFIIYSTLGQKVFEKKLLSSENNLELNDLSSGIYFYQLQTKGQTQSGKLIKQ
jgi:hypothetical protein